MKFKSTLYFVVGILSSLFGAFLTLGGIMNFAEDTEESMIGWIALILLMGVGPLALGVWLIKKSSQMKKEYISESENMTEQMMERKVLQIAADLGGKVTPSEIALKTHITLDKANGLLINMQEAGYAELEITQSGAIIYHFKGFLSDDDRENSMDLLD